MAKAVCMDGQQSEQIFATREDASDARWFSLRAGLARAGRLVQQAGILEDQRGSGCGDEERRERGGKRSGQGMMADSALALVRLGPGGDFVTDLVASGSRCMAVRRELACHNAGLHDQTFGNLAGSDRAYRDSSFSTQAAEERSWGETTAKELAECLDRVTRRFGGTLRGNKDQQATEQRVVSGSESDTLSGPRGEDAEANTDAGFGQALRSAGQRGRTTRASSNAASRTETNECFGRMEMDIANEEGRDQAHAATDAGFDVGEEASERERHVVRTLQLLVHSATKLRSQVTQVSEGLLSRAAKHLAQQTAHAASAVATAVSQAFSRAVSNHTWRTHPGVRRTPAGGWVKSLSEADIPGQTVFGAARTADVDTQTPMHRAAFKGSVSSESASKESRFGRRHVAEAERQQEKEHLGDSYRRDEAEAAWEAASSMHASSLQRGERRLDQSVDEGQVSQAPVSDTQAHRPRGLGSQVSEALAPQDFTTPEVTCGALENDDESHPQAAQDSAAHSRLARAPRILADNAGTRRRDRREQSNGVRARRSAHQKERVGARGEQGSLFVDR
jgi:hypothetical protein